MSRIFISAGKSPPIWLCNHIEDRVPKEAKWEQEVEYQPVMRLDNNPVKAMQKMRKIQEIEKRLYGLDCGSCGAPSCRCMAEDIVRGFADEMDCIFRLKEKVRYLAQGMVDLADSLDKNHSGDNK